MNLQVREARRLHLHDAQALRPHFTQQRLDRGRFPGAFVAVEEHIAGRAAVQQPPGIFHEGGALLFIEHQVAEPDRIRLAYAPQTHRVFFVHTHPGASRIAGKEARAVTAEESGHLGCARAAQHVRIHPAVELFVAQHRLPDRQTDCRASRHPRALAEQKEHGRFDGGQSAQGIQVVRQRAHEAVGHVLRLRAHGGSGALLEEHGFQRLPHKTAPPLRRSGQPGVVGPAVGFRDVLRRASVVHAGDAEISQRADRGVVQHMAQRRHAGKIQQQCPDFVQIHGRFFLSSGSVFLRFAFISSYYTDSSA